jgi:hypothetical protein
MNSVYGVSLRKAISNNGTSFTFFAWGSNSTRLIESVTSITKLSARTAQPNPTLSKSSRIMSGYTTPAKSTLVSRLHHTKTNIQVLTNTTPRTHAPSRKHPPLCKVKRNHRRTCKCQRSHTQYPQQYPAPRLSAKTRDRNSS